MLKLHPQHSDKKMLPEGVIRKMIRNNPTPYLCLRESEPARNETVNNADENMPEIRAVDRRAYCLEKFLLTRCHAPSRLVRVREELLSALKVEDVELWWDARGCISSTALPAPPRPMW